MHDLAQLPVEGAADRPPAGGPFALTRKRAALYLFALWVLLGVYVVPTEEQGVLTVFGAVSGDRVTPGVGWHWPWPVGQVHKLKVREFKRAFIGGEVADETNAIPAEPILSQFLTGDQNIINVRTVVQYSIADPADYLFRAADVDGAAAAAVEAELGRQIASRTVDEVLTTEKVAIQEMVRRRAQQLIDRYGLGVVVSTVNIRLAAPPPEAADAFRDVASARADSSRIVNEAEGYANDIVPRARGEAQQMLISSLGYKERVVNEAQGDAARFIGLAAEYARNPQVTRDRLFLETMEEVLPRFRKTIVDENGNLDLTVVRRSGEQ